MAGAKAAAFPSDSGVCWVKLAAGATVAAGPARAGEGAADSGSLLPRSAKKEFSADPVSDEDAGILGQ